MRRLDVYDMVSAQSLTPRCFAGVRVYETKGAYDYAYGAFIAEGADCYVRAIP